MEIVVDEVTVKVEVGSMKLVVTHALVHVNWLNTAGSRLYAPMSKPEEFEGKPLMTAVLYAQIRIWIGKNQDGKILRFQSVNVFH